MQGIIIFLTLSTRSAVCWEDDNTCSLELLNKINVWDVQDLYHTF